MRTWSKVLAFVVLVEMVAMPGAGEEIDPAENALDLLKQIENAFVAVADKVMPAVVSIDTERNSGNGDNGSVFRHNDGDILNQLIPYFMFPGRPNQDVPLLGQGSGFIIDSDGFILTNYHVVEQADTITVRLGSGTEYTATVHGPDPKTDLALLKIDATDLPNVELGDSDMLKVGQFVLAIGDPLSFERTMNVGHVSALGRYNISPTNREFSQENFIQTDAGISVGMSGGPLVNIAGQVVGINTLMAPFGQALGFAVPINMAKEILPELRENGRVVRGYLGVIVKSLEYGVGEEYGLPDDRGALVVEVMPGSPADESGLLSYDVIRAVNGKKILNANELVRAVSRLKPGAEIELLVVRDKAETHATARLVEQPVNAREEPAGAGRSPLGLVVRSFEPEDVERYGTETGVVVTEVKPGGAASRRGVEQDDVILEINRQPVSDALHFYNVLDGAQPDELVTLKILRDGRYIVKHIRVPGAD